MNARLIGWAFALVIVGLVLAGIMRNNFVMAGVSLTLFFVAPMMARPHPWWMAAVATVGSQILLGLPGVGNLHLLFMVGFVGTTVVRSTVSARQAIPASAPRKAAIVLTAITLFTAAWRGSGLKFLGSELWGGMQYVNLLAALLFYVASSRVMVSPQQLEKTIRWLFILSLVPAIAYLTVYIFPSMKWVYAVVQIGVETELHWRASEGSRWAYMQTPATWMGVLALLLYDRRRRLTPSMLLVAALSFGFLGLSGHRSVVVLQGLTAITYILVRRRTGHISQFLKAALVLIALLILTYSFVDLLPLTFQRTFAWLPGIGVTDEASESAAITSAWRIELWRQLLPMVPDYLWVGRGIAFSASDANAAAALASDKSTQHVFLTAVHAYHNGPLWLILDLGLAGLTAGLVFMIGAIIHYGRILRVLSREGWLNATYVVFYSFFIGLCVFFVTAFGDVFALCRILVVASILEILSRLSEAKIPCQAAAAQENGPDTAAQRIGRPGATHS